MKIQNLSQIKYDEQGLIPAIIQDAENLDVLMMAYMNVESLNKTLNTEETWFYSRSRQQLWNKGATSGNIQKVEEIFYDCDADTLLIKVNQQGNKKACHEDMRTCFHNRLNPDGTGEELPDYTPNGGVKLGQMLGQVNEVVYDRKEKMPEGAYTTYLFEKGIDKILKKVGEECTESVIAAKNRDPAEVAYEVSDLLYHLLVMLAEQEVPLEKLAEELKRRR
ncbi:bifunctional phosphoribosyl-AMP cyclohydrolase/phosphoribosyl-ATP diphosphatase HisIE [Clostridia bacterium]|nr:bifunctional phosphoribosyl-AMP cyclohydrolase/phosphoribosyl-ATP diphosphatase HisIE [Clostridia bacterium]